MEKTPLVKLWIYPVVYKKDTDGNIVENTSGFKVVEKTYDEVNIDDDYTILVEYKQIT